MAEFKVVVNDPKTGKSYQKGISGTKANSLIGKRIGQEIDGVFVDLPGYKLTITGGTDKDGFPMRPNLQGPGRKKLLLKGGIGFHPKRGGMRKRKMIRGNTVSGDIVQINMKITQYGPKPIEEAIKEGEA